MGSSISIKCQSSLRKKRNSIFFIKSRDKKPPSSYTVLPSFEMCDEYKIILQKHFRSTMLEQRPDIFHKTMLMCMQSSPKLNEIVACQMYCYRDLTKWPKLNQISQAQLNFYDRLIFVLKLDGQAVAEAVYALGIIHYRYAQYGLKPHFLDLYEQHIQTFISKMKFEDGDEKELYLVAFNQLSSYITSTINLAYSRCQMAAMKNSHMKDT